VTSLMDFGRKTPVEICADTALLSDGLAVPLAARFVCFSHGFLPYTLIFRSLVERPYVQLDTHYE